MRKFGGDTFKKGVKTMNRRFPAAANMIVELFFIVSVTLIILGAFFDKFVNNPLFSVISVIVVCVSIFSWAYLQGT